MMEVIIVESNKKDFLDLLILADEQESMIDKYLERGELFALYDGDLKSVCVVTRESDEVCELKNIATYEKWQGKGYGSKLLNHIFSHYKGKYRAMLVGTGDSPWIIQFYQKNGFRISHRIKGFFTDNYDHPIFEDGVQLVDMVYLKRSLCRHRDQQKKGIEMIEVKRDQMSHIAPLFAGFEDSMVLSCLQGYMGNAYAETLDHPKAGLIVSGEYSFFAGDPNSTDAINLIKNLFDANKSETTIVIFDDDNPEWEKRLLSVPENNPSVVPRFGIVQKDYEFDDNVLRKYIDALPEGFDLVRFDKNIYEQAMREEWSREFCEVFSSAEDYLARGFGYAVLENGRMVSGASTMTVYDGGVEIQVATDEKYRRRGLAISCAAALVQECSRRNIRPCWDAANLTSKKMALNLGYEYKGEYKTIHMKRSLSQ